jgi:hypothetical protein
MKSGELGFVLCSDAWVVKGKESGTTAVVSASNMHNPADTSRVLHKNTSKENMKIIHCPKSVTDFIPELRTWKTPAVSHTQTNVTRKFHKCIRKINDL